MRAPFSECKSLNRREASRMSDVDPTAQSSRATTATLEEPAGNGHRELDLASEAGEATEGYIAADEGQAVALAALVAGEPTTVGDLDESAETGPAVDVGAAPAVGVKRA